MGEETLSLEGTFISVLCHGMNKIEFCGAKPECKKNYVQDSVLETDKGSKSLILYTAGHNPSDVEETSGEKQTCMHTCSISL